MPLDQQQKKIIYVTAALIVILLLLIIVLVWQKNNLLNNKDNIQPTTPQNNVNQLEFDTDSEKTEKQKLIEQVAPNTDLNQFDLPEPLINKELIQNPNISPAYNRSGRITEINLNNSSITFLDMTFEEKYYEVKVDDNTKIQITNIIETYSDTNSPTPSNVSTKSFQGKLSDLKVGDNINVRAQQMINSDSYTALFIETTHITSKIINN